MDTYESRPHGAAPESTAQTTETSLPPLTAEDWEHAARAVNGLFVAVVHLASDRLRRYPYATLAAAQRKVDRARENGHEASVVLAELRPVVVLPEVVG
ncbi:hypothetical protein CLV30_11758 [Haloactinopolyspora alba]|uniref:Uncharacterized protein n=1 Tax=Haloactinopolyspora alba TaxID=648780 RepID=A0A2P8DRB5_9ACTN|nr:hypothetical protein [Haloactinopolyspora alba]PSK99755.1 hypothetical protein CLV30_11758 [Haloactinopolyspora alba]